MSEHVRVGSWENQLNSVHKSDDRLAGQALHFSVRGNHSNERTAVVNELVKSQNSQILVLVGTCCSKIIKGLVGHPNDVVANELGSFPSTILLVF